MRRMLRTGRMGQLLILAVNWIVWRTLQLKQVARYVSVGKWYKLRCLSASESYFLIFGAPACDGCLSSLTRRGALETESHIQDRGPASASRVSSHNFTSSEDTNYVRYHTVSHVHSYERLESTINNCILISTASSSQGPQHL
jgi:hypothetical protein